MKKKPTIKRKTLSPHQKHLREIERLLLVIDELRDQRDSVEKKEMDQIQIKECHRQMVVERDRAVEMVKRLQDQVARLERNGDPEDDEPPQGGNLSADFARELREKNEAKICNDAIAKMKPGDIAAWPMDTVRQFYPDPTSRYPILNPVLVSENMRVMDERLDKLESRVRAAEKQGNDTDERGLAVAHVVSDCEKSVAKLTESVHHIDRDVAMLEKEIKRAKVS